MCLVCYSLLHSHLYIINNVYFCVDLVQMSVIHSQSFHSAHSYDSKADSVTRSNAMLFDRRREPLKEERPYRYAGIIYILDDYEEI